VLDADCFITAASTPHFLDELAPQADPTPVALGAFAVARICLAGSLDDHGQLINARLS
jgi:hypothetical protein